MKANLSTLCLLSACAFSVEAAKKVTHADAPTRQYVFVENDNDNNFFVTPDGALDPRLTGSNRWTGLKSTGSGLGYQESLGYIDNGLNTVVPAGAKFDMWLENAPVVRPLQGQRCINWYSGCDLATGMLQPELIDVQGFYGVTTTSGGLKWMHGLLSETFFNYLNTVPVNSNFTMTINTCKTTEDYNIQSGERCVDTAKGDWASRKVSHTKGAHLKFNNTGAFSEIFINSDGIPTIGEGNSECKLQVIGTRSGLACKLVSYNLQHNGMSNLSIRVFPSLNNSALSSAVAAADMQFSLNGQNWKTNTNGGNYYTFNDMKSNDSIYLFLSSNFFKQMINLGLSDTITQDLFNFRMKNTNAPESGWYEFSTSSQLIVKPRDFSVSIISADYTQYPTRTGNVGRGKPSLDFDYIITTNGRSSADEVMINVTGPSQQIQGRPWCIFTSPDRLTRVPFPATLSFLKRNGTRENYDVGCDGQWRDMTDALWISTPWSDPNGTTGVMDKSTVRYSIGMDAPQSLQTIDNKGWYGEVSAAGEIHIKATWRNVP